MPLAEHGNRVEPGFSPGELPSCARRGVSLTADVARNPWCCAVFTTIDWIHGAFFA